MSERRRRRPRRGGSGAPQAPVAEAARRLGIQRLHPEQQQVIRETLAGRDVLMILPTGFGKSACYQIPSMVLPRPVVVVSPLVALLRDQHQRLRALGVPCVRLDGTVRGSERRRALEAIAAGGPLLVMTTPETLATPDLGDPLRSTGVALAAVDEAHCISEWGHDFRPAYRRLGAGLAALGGPPVLALTATATPPVRDAIVRALHMRDPCVVAASPHRSNLAFEVVRCEGDERLRATLRFGQRLRRPGIVYCATRREVDLVWGLFQRFGVPGHRYHGGMTAGDRNEQQERFMRPGRRTIMVATNAFGLGIDRRDIRYVLHFQAPAALESYVQEAGRAGRDGRRAHCILLHDPADRRIHEALLARSRVRPDQLYRLGRALAAWSEEGREPTLEALAVSAELGPRITTALLAKLEEAGLVHWEGDRIAIEAGPDGIESDARGLAAQFERLRTEDSRRLDAVDAYAAASGCRAAFLRRYFGEPDGTPCGLCDDCLGRGERPASLFAPLAPPASPAPGRSRRGRRSRGPGRRGGGRRRSPGPV